MKFLKLSTLGLVCLEATLLSGCASTRVGGDPNLSVVAANEFPQPDSQDLAPKVRGYVIGPFDRLSIDVLGIEELTALELEVSGAGAISVPFIGEVQVAGLSPTEARGLLANRLGADYYRNPEVRVAVKQVVSQTITIEGEVKRPGIYPVVGEMSLLRAMALAQGGTELARLKDVIVFRTVNNRRYAALYNLDAIRRGAYPDPEIFPRDTIVVGDSKMRRLLRDIMSASPLLTTPVVLIDNLAS